MYRYILFDLDGTLTDSKEGIVNSVRWTLRSMDAPVPEEEILQLFIGPPLQDSFERFCGFSPERAVEAVAVFRERYLPVGQFENRAAPGAAERPRRALPARRTAWSSTPLTRKRSTGPLSRSSRSGPAFGWRW